ncbi:MAG: hypothetical protein TREMPRED_000590 [Tremellales sp. Tagirdzhanova-0007]|nr:MAG: hypothetical protein TREMPRED_000590 [Tremellales sp. Tagirdzhanova-0007]
MFNLSLGEAHIIRHVLGTDEVMVVHHTDCGFSKAILEDIVRKEVGTSVGLSVDWVSFMPIGGPGGVRGSVEDDVEYLRMSPYDRKGMKITGWILPDSKGDR